MGDAFRRLRSGCEQARGNEEDLRRLDDRLLQRAATVEELVQAVPFASSGYVLPHKIVDVVCGTRSSSCRNFQQRDLLQSITDHVLRALELVALLQIEPGCASVPK